MPYIIPSQKLSPGTAYQSKVVAPAYVKQNARALYLARPGAYSSTRLLDQSPLNSGTRRTGNNGGGVKGDGTDDEIIFGDIGTAIWFSGWVRLDSDNQCLFSLSNSTATALSVAAGVLTAGATLTLTGIKIDNVSKTASEAGALLNDNAWHFLSCGIGDGLGGASTADDVRYFTDGTAHGAVSAFDWRFYSTAPTAFELTEAYSGDSPNRNAAALSKYAAWTPLEEQDGTTAYDISGNAITGTLTNMTLANARITHSLFSFTNQVGYNLSGSVYIPRDESNPSKDVLGPPLTYTGRRPNDGALINSNCLTLNGANQAGRIPDNTALDITDNLTVMCWAKNDNSSLSAPEVLLAKWNSAASLRVLGFYIDTNRKLICQIGTSGGGSSINNTTTDSVNIDSVNHYCFSFSGGNVKIYLNGVNFSFSSSGVLPATILNLDAPFTIGSNYDNNVPSVEWDGQFFDARIYAGDSTVLTDEQIAAIYNDPTGNIQFSGQDLRAHYKLAEGSGTQILDASGNGNHGTIENAASNWSVKQDVYHSNLLDGFTLYEHASSDPIRVPFDKNGQPVTGFTPPSGYTKTADCPFVDTPRNRAETKFAYNPDSTPEMGSNQLGITVPSAHAFGDSYSASTQIFSRQRTETEDRTVVMPEAQSGDALTTLQNYTAS